MISVCVGWHTYNYHSYLFLLYPSPKGPIAMPENVSFSHLNHLPLCSCHLANYVPVTSHAYPVCVVYKGLVAERPTTTLARTLGENEHMWLTRLSDNDDIEAYLTTLERMMEAYEVERARWSFKLAPQLTGKAQQAYAALPPEGSLGTVGRYVSLLITGKAFHSFKIPRFRVPL